MENAASRFGQHLAHTEQKYRDRALKKLSVYLTKKKAWTSLEWDKLWMALFYCMWMSDKRPVQEELSSNLAALVHCIPSIDLALDFVHSFFRTMQREWHGLDGLRLDKFYSLVRKFVRETVVLFRTQDWKETLVQQFVTILLTEVVSQLPNGLRLHLADLYLTEMYNAAGKDITTEAFLMLLEPFFTLLRSEYDKTVFKRVREVVFEEMLTKYKFGPQSKTREEDAKEETDEEEEDEEEHKVFEKVELAQVQHCIFAIASADDTAERNRSALYTLYKKFFTITRVDSLQAAQEEAAKPKNKAVRKETKQREEKLVATKSVTKCTKDEEGCDQSMKSKKRKINTGVKVEPEAAIVKTEVVKEVKFLTASVKKKAKKQKAVTEVKVEKVEMTNLSAETEKGTKKHKMIKQEKQEVKVVALVGKAAAVSVKDKKAAKEPPKVQKERAESKEIAVTRSGNKFKRCANCGGFGKGLVQNDKNLCGHCERTRKKQTRKAASALKKRKAEVQAEAVREEQQKMESSKKVTFGKSKALRHAVSIKRLKASAKRDAVSKDVDDIKGVLKVSTPLRGVSKKSKVIETQGKTASDVS
ncbi:unnamed protein product [Peronospora belbahrii]|uniref:Uncharacterized protein n=1 Tax=Peronospora belbahrii TaxID=622444 RepID=A0AAU9L7A4_9STRA|nr:unnamed protein product [Peronospora belbahrii]CAH0516884.1 unnamed protein product [Peronospora belbahrii]